MELNLSKINTDVFIANGIDKPERQRRQQLVHAYPHLANFAFFMTDNSGLDPSKLTEIVNGANRFGEYRKSIAQVLDIEIDFSDLENVTPAEEEQLMQKDADYSMYLLILKNFYKYSHDNDLSIPPELNVDQPGSSIHLQTLSEYITSLFQW